MAGGAQSDPAIPQKRLAHDFKWLASQEQGKRILRHLYKFCGQGLSSIRPGEGEKAVFVREGSRLVWLEIDRRIKWKLGEREKVITEEETT